MLLLVGLLQLATLACALLGAASIFNIPMSVFLLSSLLSLAAIAIAYSRSKILEKVLQKLSEDVSRIHENKPLSAIDSSGEMRELDSKLHQIKLRISEIQKKQHAVVNHAVDVICSIGSDQTFQSVNRASKKLWGFEPEELVGKKLSDIIVAEDMNSTMKDLAALGLERSADISSFENRVRRKDGSVMHVLWSAHWSAADNALFCVAHDITARKAAERVIEESEARIRQIVETMPVGLIIGNKLGIIEATNPKLNNLSSYLQQELVGKHLQFILSDYFKTQAPPNYKKLVGALVDTTIRNQSGENIPIHLTANEIGIGTDTKFLLALVDTSEQQKLEQLKKEFFAMVSHDLRSPLTSLLSVMDALMEGALGELNEDGKQMLQRNAREVQRLVKLVDELLDIEKMNAGKFVIDAERSAVDVIVESSVNAVENFAKRRGIKISYDKSDTYVFADSSLLIRVLVNLLSNAIKFSPAQATIRIGVKKENNEVVFSVTDTGRGIREEDHKRIFEQYHQLEKSDSLSKGGSGLGLSISKLIIEQHGGKIWVDSVLGEGSTFHFSLPDPNS